MERIHSAHLLYVIFIAGLSPSLSARGGITVGGSIDENTTWTLENSPVVVTSPVTVIETACLIIEPGVVVRFQPGTGLTIGDPSVTVPTLAKLSAVGTAAAPIVFTSDEPTPVPGSWNGIWFRRPLEGSRLEHCMIEYAGSGASNGEAAVRISSTQARVVLLDCTIRSSSHKGIFASSSCVIERVR
jgi:hypothetical protein